MKLIVLLLIILSLTSCVHHAIRSSKKPNCKTKLVGAYYFNDRWNGKAPALFLKKYSNDLYFGKIIEINDRGCIFDPEKTRRGDIDASLYEYEDIACIVDSNNQIIYGKIPKKYAFNWHLTIYLRRIGGKGNDVVIESITPNEKYSYCIPSGKYKVENITFIRNNDTRYTDFTKEFSKMVLDFSDDSSIYIGDITLDSIMKDSEIIPFKVNEGKRAIDKIANDALGSILYKV